MSHFAGQAAAELQLIKPLRRGLEVSAEGGGIVAGEARLDAVEGWAGVGIDGDGEIVRVGGGRQEMGEGVGEDEVGIASAISVPFEAAGGGDAAVGCAAEESPLFAGVG